MRRSCSWWTFPRKRGCRPRLPPCAWSACCTGCSAGCSSSQSPRTGPGRKSNTYTVSFPGPEAFLYFIPLLRDLVSAALCWYDSPFVGTQSIKIRVWLYFFTTSWLTCSMAVWILLCQVLTLSSSSTRLSSTKSTTLSSPILTWTQKMKFSKVCVGFSPLLPQSEALVCHFGRFCSLAEHILKLCFDLLHFVVTRYKV